MPRRAAVLAAAGRILHSPSAATPAFAAAQQQRLKLQQPRTRLERTRNVSSSATADHSSYPAGPTPSTSTNGSAQSSSSSRTRSDASNSFIIGNGAEHESSSKQNAPPEAYSMACCMRLLAIHSAFVSQWNNSSSNNTATPKIVAGACIAVQICNTSGSIAAGQPHIYRTTFNSPALSVTAACTQYLMLHCCTAEKPRTTTQLTAFCCHCTNYTTQTLPLHYCKRAVTAQKHIEHSWSETLAGAWKHC